MTDPLQRTMNDLGVLPQTPDGAEKISVVLAEEQRLQTESSAYYTYISRGEPAWVKPPEVIRRSNTNTFDVRGQAYLPIFPANNLQIDFPVNIPLLKGNPNSSIDREDFLYLIGIGVEVGAEQDPVLGELSFQYRERNETTQEIEIKQMTGENSRRLRSYVFAILTPEPLTKKDVNAIFDVPTTTDYPAHHRITITKLGVDGFPLGLYHVWPMDINWKQGKSYIIYPEYTDPLPICKIRRTLNSNSGGIIDTGVDIVDLILQGSLTKDDLDVVVWKKLIDIFTGFDQAYRKAVLNLGLGSFSINPAMPGEAAIATNDSNMVANGQRMIFFDQEIADTFSAFKVRAENSEGDRPLVSLTLRPNLPFGTQFSEGGHKIFDLKGQNQTNLGRFTRLQGSVIAWVGSEGSTIKPGNECYLQPSIVYPGGSGFKIPFRSCEKIFIRSQELPKVNIREGGQNDIQQYESPAGNIPFIVITARERSGVLYIYQEVILTSSSEGILAVPPESNGVFAFIEGVSGRINSPVVTGLRPNTSYRTLCYHPPIPEEYWQFLLNYPRYLGTGEAGLITDAEIVSDPIFFIHTQGGGNLAFRGEESLRFSPIAKYLPSLGGRFQIPSWELKGPIHLINEPYPGPITALRVPVSPASMMVQPMVGQKLSLFIGAEHHFFSDRSIRGTVMVNDKPLGWRIPHLSHQSPCQGVISFLIKQDDKIRLFIACHNGPGGAIVTCDSSKSTAFDLFDLT
jgi:hypothetical protein